MTYTERVAEHLLDCIYPAIANADVFASELGISPSKLRRELAAEGTSWKAIRSAEMLQRVDALRREGVSEAGIAEALGYETFQGYTRFLSENRPKAPPWEAPRFLRRRATRKSAA